MSEAEVAPPPTEEAPAAEEPAPEPEKKEPAMMKWWKAAEKPVSEKIKEKRVKKLSTVFEKCFLKFSLNCFLN